VGLDLIFLFMIEHASDISQAMIADERGMSSSALRAKNWVRFVIFAPDRNVNMLAVEVDGMIHVARQICRRCDRMRLAPQGCRDREGINPLALPPGPLIAASVEFTMVQPADRDREPIADFPPHRPLLGKLDVVGIRRGAAANKPRLIGHELLVRTASRSPRSRSFGPHLVATPSFRCTQ
jgi:hypothetical protein